MSDEYIKRSQALKEISDAYEYEYPTASGAFDEFATTVVPNVLRNIPAADIVTLEDHERMKREMNTEIEGLKKAKDIILARNFATNVCQETLIERAKAEVIKEFEERLLEAIREHHYLLSDHCNSRDYGMFTVGIEQAICETKNEMVGDTK